MLLGFPNMRIKKMDPVIAITMAASGFSEATGYQISTIFSIGADAGLATVFIGGLVIVAIHCWNTGTIGWVEGSSMLQCWDAAKKRLQNIRNLLGQRQKRPMVGKDDDDDPG